MEALDREVLAAIAGDVLNPSLVEEVVAAARVMYDASSRQAQPRGSDGRRSRRRL